MGVWLYVARQFVRRRPVIRDRFADHLLRPHVLNVRVAARFLLRQRSAWAGRPQTYEYLLMHIASSKRFHIQIWNS